jgi:hypothetical protein
MVEYAGDPHVHGRCGCTLHIAKVDDLALPKDVMRDAVDRLEGQAVPVMFSGDRTLAGMVGEAKLSIGEDGQLAADVRFLETDNGKAVRELVRTQKPRAGFSIASKVERNGLRIVKADISNVDFWRGK